MLTLLLYPSSMKADDNSDSQALRLSASKGDTVAQLACARQFFKKMSTYKDRETFKREWKEVGPWMTAAAKRGNLFAQEFLGLTLNYVYDDTGVNESIKWSTIAANRGSLISIMTLAQYYSHRDKAEYNKWSKLFDDKWDIMTDDEKVSLLSTYGVNIGIRR